MLLRGATGDPIQGMRGGLSSSASSSSSSSTSSSSTGLSHSIISKGVIKQRMVTSKGHGGKGNGGGGERGGHQGGLARGGVGPPPPNAWGSLVPGLNAPLVPGEAGEEGGGHVVALLYMVLQLHSVSSV